MVVIECQRLLAVARIFGVIEVENQALRRAGETGYELLHECLADAVNILAAGRMFETRNRRPRRQRGVIVERKACRSELEHRIVAQAVRVVAIFVAAADLVDTLGQKIVIRMADVTLMATVRQGCSEAFGQADLEIDAT